MKPDYRDGWTVAEPSYMQQCPEGHDMREGEQE